MPAGQPVLDLDAPPDGPCWRQDHGDHLVQGREGKEQCGTGPVTPAGRAGTARGSDYWPHGRVKSARVALYPDGKAPVLDDASERPAVGRGTALTAWMRRHKITTGLGVLFLVGALGNALPASPPAPTKVTVAADVNATPSPVMTQAPPVPTPVPTLTTAAVTASPVPTRMVTQQVVRLHGVAEPDRSLTPGSLLSGSTQARICTAGYTRTVRHVSAATRRSVFQAYRIAYPPARGAYELDHLIPLELGGGNAATNLWPEPSRGVGSAGVKDQLENHLHALVCSGQLGLLQAQRAIAGDWYAAASKYNSVRVATAMVSRPAPAATGTTAAVPAGSGATAQCNDGTYSFAAHHQGACSRHGGVRVFFR